MSRDVRTVLTMALVGVLLIAASLPALGQTRRAPAKRPPAAKPAPVPATPYGQGYARSYDAGYKAGQDDYSRGTPRDLRASQAFQNREQNYDQNFADSEEYRQAYNLGLELGYLDGYYGRPRNLTVPANGSVIAKAAALAASQRARRDDTRRDDYRRDDTRRDDTRRDDTRRDDTRRDDASRAARPGGPVDIPAGTQLNLRLTSRIDSKQNHVGDRFTAEVTTPGDYEGAVVEGHIEKLNPSGKVTGRTEMALAFDSIRLRDGRSADLTASLDKIIESETVKTVDEEGNVKSGSRTKESQTRGAIGGAAGAIIGGIAGGVKGAVLGAIIGGAAGVGTVYIEGNKELILDPGTEMVIRTERTRTR
jgi:outer membrane lipoprotein SlyB